MDRAPDDLIEFYVNKPTDDSLGEINKNIIAGFVSQNIFGAPWSNGHEQAILPFVTTPTSQCLGAFQGEEGYTFLSCWDWLQGWWIPQNQDLEIVGLIFREPVFISQMETIWTKDTSDTPKTDFSKGVITVYEITEDRFVSPDLLLPTTKHEVEHVYDFVRPRMVRGVAIARDTLLVGQSEWTSDPSGLDYAVFH